MSKERIVYKEVYKGKGLKINDRQLPDLNHLNPGFYANEAYIKSIGVVERDGKEIEFSDIRVYVTERGN